MFRVGKRPETPRGRKILGALAAILRSCVSLVGSLGLAAY